MTNTILPSISEQRREAKIYLFLVSLPMIIVLATILLLPIWLSRCTMNKNHTTSPPSIQKWDNIDPNAPGSHNPAIIYTIVTIEGKEYLATKGAYGFWYLSGPLNVLTIEKDMIDESNTSRNN